MKRLLLLMPALFLLTIASGCGQSGPLYLPGNPSQIQAPPEPPAEQDEDEEKPGTDNEE